MCAAQVADDYAEKTWRVKFDLESQAAEEEAAKAATESVEDKAVGILHWVLDSPLLAPVRSTVEVCVRRPLTHRWVHWSGEARSG